MLASTDQYDALILDRMLPGIDGFSIIKSLRNNNVTTPVLILSALASVDERVKGLRAGGDDYLTKPFSFSELLVRVEILAKRKNSHPISDTILQVSDLKMDLLARRVWRGSHEVILQGREFKLLEVLMRHTGQVVTRTLLLEKVWSYNFDPQTNIIDVHISRLRSKVDRGFKIHLLHTVRGAGYKIEA